MWLEVLSGEDAGRLQEVDRRLVLGRVQGSDLVIRDARASRRHVELEPVDGGVRLRDLGSANGTLVDGAPASETTLRGGEEIRIGDVRIAVLAHEPAVTGAPIAEPVCARPQVETEGPSWSMIGRLVESRTRRGRRCSFPHHCLPSRLLPRSHFCHGCVAHPPDAELTQLAGFPGDRQNTAFLFCTAATICLG